MGVARNVLKNCRKERGREYIACSRVA